MVRKVRYNSLLERTINRLDVPLTCRTRIKMVYSLHFWCPVVDIPLQYAQDMFDGLFQTADSLANQVSAASTRCSRLLQVCTNSLPCWRSMCAASSLDKNCSFW